MISSRIRRLRPRLRSGTLLEIAFCRIKASANGSSTLRHAPTRSALVSSLSRAPTGALLASFYCGVDVLNTWRPIHLVDQFRDLRSIVHAAEPFLNCTKLAVILTI
jgi:hypothetical protein